MRAPSLMAKYNWSFGYDKDMVKTSLAALRKCCKASLEYVNHSRTHSLHWHKLVLRMSQVAQFVALPLFDAPAQPRAQHKNTSYWLTRIVATMISKRLRKEWMYLVSVDTIDTYMILGCGIRYLNWWMLFKRSSTIFESQWSPLVTLNV